MKIVRCAEKKTRRDFSRNAPRADRFEKKSASCLRLVVGALDTNRDCRDTISMRDDDPLRDTFARVLGEHFFARRKGTRAWEKKFPATEKFLRNSAFASRKLP